MKEILFDFILDLCNFIIRGLITLPYLIIPYFFWGFNRVLGQVLLISIVIDTILGFVKGWKTNSITSEKMKRIAEKFIKYGCAIATAGQIQRTFYELSIPCSITFKDISLTVVVVILLGLIYTEVFSIIENLGELGLHIPPILAKHIEVLKKLYMKKRNPPTKK